MSLLFSCLVMSNHLQPHGLQYTRLSVPHHLLKFAQVHVHHISDAISSSVTLFSFCCPSFLPSGTFPMSQLFILDDQNNWSFIFSISSSSEYSGLISLKINWFDLLLLPSIFRSIRVLSVPHSLDYMDFVWPSNVSAFQHTV